MKKTIILLLTLFTLTAFSQVGIPDNIEIPKSYERQLKKQARKVKRYEKKHDVVIPIEESIAIPVSFDQLGYVNWGLEALQVNKYKWQIRQKQGKRKVLFLDFDTAGSYDHKSLKKAALPGYVFTGEKPYDGHGHGTHTAGNIVSDNVNIGVGSILVEDGYFKVMPMKMLHNKGWGNNNEILASYEKGLQIVEEYTGNGWIVVCNNSWGGGNLDPRLDAIFKKIEALGGIIVTASGNNGSGKIGSPSDSKYSLSSGAMDKNFNRASFSQYGVGLDFVGPGVAIASTLPSDAYGIFSGSSMGTPHVAAIIGLVAAYWPNATAAEIVAHVRKYAKPEGWNQYTGYGYTAIGDLINNRPEKIDDTPDDPGDDDPIDDEPIDEVVKKERDISIPLNDLKVVWGIGKFTDQRPLIVDLKIRVLSTKLAEVTYDDAYNIAHSFFGRRGILFTDKKADFWDAQEWTARFFHRYANTTQGEYWIEIDEITVTDSKGRVIVRDATALKILESEKVEWKDIPTLIIL